MRATISIGSTLGIPVGVHCSWPPVFALVTWSLAARFFPFYLPSLPAASYWLLGISASLLFFGSLLAHEFGHSIAAQRMGLGVKGVTLFLFGGVAEIESEPERPRDDFILAAAGPAISMVLSMLSGAVWWLTALHAPTIAGVALYLVISNALLVVFNMIPALPLDGGRILRALLWRQSRDFLLATRVAAGLGRALGMGIGAAGVAVAFGGGVMSGLWLVVVGGFLGISAHRLRLDHEPEAPAE